MLLRQSVQISVLLLLSLHSTCAQYDKLLNHVPKTLANLVTQPFDMISLFGLKTIDFNGIIKDYNEAMRMLNNYLLDKFEFLDFEQKLSNLSRPCMNQTIVFLKAFITNKEWAAKTVDAWGKPSSAIFNGGLNWLGEYAQCLGVSELSSYEWNSKYCLVQRNYPGSVIKMRYGACVSDSCDTADIANLLSYVLDILSKFTDNSELTQLLTLNSSYIECKTDKPLNTSALISIVIISLIILAILLASMCEKIKDFREERQKRANQCKAFESKLDVHEEKETVLSSISIFKNAKKIFNTTNNSDEFDCLHGIRVLSVSWIILGHTYLEFTLNSNNSRVVLEWLSSFWFLFIVNGTFSVDTFFVIRLVFISYKKSSNEKVRVLIKTLLSGFLLSYYFLRETRRLRSRITPFFMFKYYFHRFWRLTPAYYITLLITAFLSRYLGNGPMFPKNGFEEHCDKNWWTNLLYVQNLVEPEKICFSVSWYLSADMQFHWISPIMLIPFALNKKNIGYLLCGMFMIANIVTTYHIINANPGYELALVQNLVIAARSFIDIYIKPWCRVGPFIVGILIGRYVHELKSEQTKFNIDKGSNLFGWVISTGSCLFMIFALYNDISGIEPLNRTSRILYQTFSRLVWGCSVAYVILTCVTSNGGIVNKFLSLKLWYPLSRLSYAVYLVHHLVIKFFIYRSEHAVYLQHELIFFAFIANWLISYICGFFLSIFFESPFIGLEKRLLPNRKISKVTRI